MKITARRLLVGGGLFSAILLALLAWWMWPQEQLRPKKPLVVQQRKAKTPIMASSPAAIPQFKEPTKILEELGIDPKETPHCAILNQWAVRGVPAFSMVKNIDAQAMYFDEKELACVTASPLPGGILEMAEQRVKKPVPPGARNAGGPGDPPPPPPGG